MAGMATDTGDERRSDGSLGAAGPTVPAAAGPGDGACCWASTATPMAAAPPSSSAAPASPDSLILARPGSGGAGANWLSGHDMTTRSPPIRGQRLNAVPFLPFPNHRPSPGQPGAPSCLP